MNTDSGQIRVDPLMAFLVVLVALLIGGISIYRATARYTTASKAVNSTPAEELPSTKASTKPTVTPSVTPRVTTPPLTAY